MKKPVKIFLIAIGVLISLWVVGRLTNALQFYRVSTGSNYPNMKVGENFFSTNLLSPARNDLVCYRAEDPYFGKHIRIHRVVGTAGDIVEMKGGVLIVNGKNADVNRQLAHSYILDQTQLIKLIEGKLIGEDEFTSVGEDRFQVNLADEMVRSTIPDARRLVISAGESTPEIVQVFKENWNPDHFGPVTVPKGNYFLMGDNRHASQDSRYAGFVDKSRIVGVVIGH
jgi:signal peptidase I